MPELPEVESVRRGLEDAHLVGPVVRVWRSAESLRIGEHWAKRQERVARLRGASPGPVGRRGKYIVWQFEREGVATVLVLHLGMSGRCGVVQAEAPRPLHTHLVLSFPDGREMRFVDPRRFGGLRVLDAADVSTWPPLAQLGPEPLDPGFDGGLLARALARRRIPIRDALLDQRAVAGVGNIYAVESLFEARIHPLRLAESLGRRDWDRLAESLRAALVRGIEHGGTTLKDFRSVTGEVGRNQDDLRVYGRVGAACPACSAPLTGGESQGRSFVVCARCQPMRPARAPVR